MKRGGFALISYILYTVLFGGLTLMFYYEMDKLKDEKLFGAFALIFLVLIGLCVSLAIGGLVAVVLKLLHMATGWPVFGILCITIDVGMVGCVITSIVELGSNSSATFVFFIPLLLSIGALISNIRSLRN
jgi:hypothetical protein